MASKATTSVRTAASVPQRASAPIRVKGAGKQPLPTNTYIAIVAAIVALIVIACIFISYQLIRLDIVDAKVIAGDSTASSQLKTKLNNAPIVVSAYNDLGSKQQLIADALPNDPDFPQAVALMDSIAAASGVQLKSIAPTAATQGNAPTAGSTSAASTAASSSATPYGISVEVEGPYTQIVNYFQNLELSARPMKVLSSAFQGSSSDLQATIEIQTYYQPQADVSDKTKAVK